MLNRILHGQNFFTGHDRPHIFEALVSRQSAHRRMIDELLAFFGGRTQPVVAHLIDSGRLTLEDVQQAERMLRKLARKEKA